MTTTTPRRLLAAVATFVLTPLTPHALAAQRPQPPADPAVQVIRGGPYRDGGDSAQHLFLYQAHARPGTRAPTIVFIHGGGLTSGDYRDAPAEPMCGNFAGVGIGCVSVNYRLVKQAKWPAQPQDVAAAVAYVIRHVAQWGGDSTRIVLLGHSSGCHLATLIASDPRYLAEQGLSPRDLAGVVALGCLLHQIPPAISDSVKLREFFSSGRWVYPSLDAFRDADPTLHVGPHVPPTLVLVAESEQVQPPILDSAERFAQRMRNAGRPVEIEVLPNRSHMTALTMMADPLDPTFLRIVGFVSTARP